MKFFIYRLTSIVFLMSFFLTSNAQVGANMSNPINAGTFPGYPYQESRNNSGYTNDIGHSSPDIYYKVVVNNAGILTASHCTSSFDTYILLLDEFGNIVASNDDNNGCSSYYQARLTEEVFPGTYYVVSEGWNTNTGNITTYISFDPQGSRMDNAIQIGELKPGHNFQDLKNNSPANQYMDNYGRLSHDFYHTFTVTTPLEVTLSHCGSQWDTFIHLLDASGNLVTSNDDNTACGLQARVNLTLNPGQYYIVSETYGSATGDIQLNVTVPGESPELNCTEPMDPQEFASLEWYDNNDYLENFLDSIGYDEPEPDPSTSSKNGATTSSIRYGIKFWIPIQLHFLGSSRASDLEVRNAIQTVNEIYASNRTNIQFYLRCAPNILSSSDYWDLSSSEQRQLSRKYDGSETIHVFIPGKIQGRMLAGLTSTSTTYSTIFITETVFKSYLTTLAHELGHRLKLLHTHEHHETWDLVEPVSRSRKANPMSLRFKPMCEWTGDALRDTPADPNLSSNNNTTCQFTLNWEDPWGDSYLNPPSGSSQPMARNVMSYNGARECRTQFTRMQIAVMLNYLERKSNHGQVWKMDRYKVDEFEPNNTANAANTISLGETQLHNFHFQSQTMFNINSNTSCDVDWLKFECPRNGTTDFRTWATDYNNHAHTKLTLFASNQTTQLATSSQTGDNFSQVSYNCVAGATYYIKVENRLPTNNGFYNITIGCDISNVAIQGPEYFCGQATYEMAGLPPNSTVNWSQSGSLSTSLSGNAYNVSSSYSEFVILTATVNAPCSAPIAVTKRIAVNNPSPPYGENMIYCWDTPNQPGGYNFSIPEYPGAISYEWYAWGTGSTYVYQNGTNHCGINFSSGGGYTVLVKVITDCGELWLDSQQLEIYIPGYNGYGSYAYSYSPNPASNELTISYDNGLKEESQNYKLKKQKKDFDVRLIDGKGKLLRLARNTDIENKVILNTTDIPDGTYYLHINDGKETIRKQVIIKH